MKEFKAIEIKKSRNGYGGPLVIKPTEKKDKIVSMTGGGIHPVAKKIAEKTGGKVVDGFNNSPAEEEMCCVIIDCGGTARVGVYPKKNIPTININPVGKSGPLAEFIHEDIYVSGINEKNFDELVTSVDEEAVTKETEMTKVNQKESGGFSTASSQMNENQDGITGKLANFGRKIGNIVNLFYNAGRQTINQLIENIIPFMAFIATLIGIINATGLGNAIANILTPLAGTLPGLLVLTVIVSLPFLSPILGPGAVVAQVVGSLIGTEIAAGNIPIQFALPALFAINPQVGCDFIPVGLSLGEADPETQRIGVPAVLFSRVITGPIATIIAYFASFGLF